MSSNKEYMLKVASIALRKAADKIQQLYSDNEKLSSELCDLKKEAREAHNFEEATKIASKMHEKGLIKKAEIESKAYEISKFDEEALNMLNASLSSTEKVASSGVSDLSEFMVDEEDAFINQIHRKSMADSIIAAADDLGQNFY